MAGPNIMQPTRARSALPLRVIHGPSQLSAGVGRTHEAGVE
jgi:hypothetical protein